MTRSLGFGLEESKMASSAGINVRDSKILTHRRSLSVPAIIRKNFSGTSPDQKART